MICVKMIRIIIREVEFQKQYDLRNRNVVVNKDNKNTPVDISPINNKKKDSPSKQPQRKEDNMVYVISKKIIEERKHPSLKDEEKAKALFSLENEISRVKISVPFSKLIKNEEYRN